MALDGPVKREFSFGLFFKFASHWQILFHYSTKKKNPLSLKPDHSYKFREVRKAWESLTMGGKRQAYLLIWIKHTNEKETVGSKDFNLELL